MRKRTAHYLRLNHQSRMPNRLVFIGAEWYPVYATASKDRGNLECQEFAISTWTKEESGYVRRDSFRRVSASSARNVIASFASRRGITWVFSDRIAAVAAAIGLFNQDENGLSTVENWILADNTTVIYGDIQGRKVALCDARNYCNGDARYGFDAIANLRSAEGAVIPLMQMAATCDFGNWAPTAASVAWNCYRHKFMRTRILIHAIPEVIALERRCYYGGQVIVGKEGKAECSITQLDVNGLYAFCMQQYRMPCRLEDWQRNGILSELEDAIERGVCAADVIVRSDSEPYPVMHDGMAKYAVGRFRTSLCGRDLEHAISSGHVEAVGMWAMYLTANLFDEFFEWMGSLRLDAEKAGQPALASVAKMIPNSLYGKFASHEFEWRLDSNVKSGQRWGRYWITHPKTGEHMFARSVNDCVKVKGVKDEGKDSSPIVSAVISAAGRDHMRSLRAVVGERRVYYQDTDSIFAPSKNIALLYDSGRISDSTYGKLKVVTTSTDFEVLGPKNYLFAGKRVAAGLQKDAIKLTERFYLQTRYATASELLMDEPDGKVPFTQVKFTCRQKQKPYIVDENGFTYPEKIDEV